LGEKTWDTRSQSVLVSTGDKKSVFTAYGATIANGKKEKSVTTDEIKKVIHKHGGEVYVETSKVIKAEFMCRGRCENASDELRNVDGVDVRFGASSRFLEVTL